MFKCFLVILSFFIMMTIASADTMAEYPFSSPTQQQQFINLTKELRCLVCQNEDLYDSNANLAGDLRKEVYQRVQAGQSNVEIKSYLVSRYGNFILFKPPINTSTYLLWFSPFVLLLLLLVFLCIIVRRQKPAVQLSVQEDQIIKTILQNNHNEHKQ